eukprot:m.181766 g.181766  ORF g.181766 m.181766 type:complete len:413 (+) comp25462_c4_seq10:1597-2835(+)
MFSSSSKTKSPAAAKTAQEKSDKKEDNSSSATMPPKFNLDPKALLPGLAPSKPKPAAQVEATFDTPVTQAHVLNNPTKTRAKIQTRRRLPSRRGRPTRPTQTTNDKSSTSASATSAATKSSATTAPATKPASSSSSSKKSSIFDDDDDDDISAKNTTKTKPKSIFDDDDDDLPVAKTTPKKKVDDEGPFGFGEDTSPEASPAKVSKPKTDNKSDDEDIFGDKKQDVDLFSPSGDKKADDDLDELLEEDTPKSQAAAKVVLASPQDDKLFGDDDIFSGTIKKSTKKKTKSKKDDKKKEDKKAKKGPRKKAPKAAADANLDDIFATDDAPVPSKNITAPNGESRNRAASTVSEVDLFGDQAQDTIFSPDKAKGGKKDKTKRKKKAAPKKKANTTKVFVFNDDQDDIFDPLGSKA